MKLTIAKVDEALFRGDAASMIVPGVEGEMTILAEHTPLISPLKKGAITVRTPEGTELFFEANGGMLEVSRGLVTVLL